MLPSVQEEKKFRSVIYIRLTTDFISFDPAARHALERYGLIIFRKNANRVHKQIILKRI